MRKRMLVVGAWVCGPASLLSRGNGEKAGKVEALIWMAAIAGSIWAAFALGRKLGASYKAARNAGFVVAGFWLFWTFWFSSIIVGYAITGPLAVFQTIVILVAFIISYQHMKALRGKDSVINQLKADLDRLDNEEIRKNLNKISKSRIEVIETPREHRQKFLEALSTAQETLIILSGWATSYSVNDEFRERLRDCLTRGVNIYIGYGYKRKGEKIEEKDYERRARETLDSLRDWCAVEELKGRLKVFKYPNHAKTLIKDDEYAINGSFNWLSNIGSSQNEERSWIVYDWDFVTSERDSIISQLDDPTKPTRRGLLKRVLPWSDY